VYWYSPRFEVWLAMALTDQIIQLIIAIFIGLLSYFGSLLVFGVRVSAFKIIKS